MSEGLLGTIIGGVIVIVGQFALHWRQEYPKRKLDKARKTLLERMLRNQKYPERWRRLETMSRLIGADKETTCRLLIEIGARGSEKDDGLWGLLEYHSLDDVEQ